jgi:hypothetical protein
VGERRTLGSECAERGFDLVLAPLEGADMSSLLDLEAQSASPQQALVSLLDARVEAAEPGRYEYTLRGPIVAPLG